MPLRPEVTQAQQNLALSWWRDPARSAPKVQTSASVSTTTGPRDLRPPTDSTSRLLDLYEQPDPEHHTASKGSLAVRRMFLGMRPRQGPRYAVAIDLIVYGFLETETRRAVANPRRRGSSRRRPRPTSPERSCRLIQAVSQLVPAPSPPAGVLKPSPTHMRPIHSQTTSPTPPPAAYHAPKRARPTPKRCGLRLEGNPDGRSACQARNTVYVRV